MTADIPCAVCGEGRLHLDESSRTAEIDGKSYEVPFRSHWCDECGSVQSLSEDLRFNARAMRQIRKKHAGLLTGEEVRMRRKKLGLNQEQAAKLFGGGPVAFSKYENDEVAQSDSMNRLIWLVSEIPALVAPLSEYLNLSSSGGAKVAFERVQAILSQEYFLGAFANVQCISSALEGFDSSSVTGASNDTLYQTKKNLRPVMWKAA